MPDIFRLPGRANTALTPLREQRLLLGILVAGFFVKLLPLLLNPAEKLQPTRSEMLRVAIHWAKTGTLADAYFDGSGISSHVGPFNTILAGMVYRLFGISSYTSEFLLSAIALLFVSLMIFFFHQALRRAGVAALPCLVAAAILAILPQHWGLEAFDFRIREGATAAMLMGALLWWVLVLDQSGRLAGRQILLFGLVAGFAFLIHPVIALGAYAGLGFVALRHLPVGRWPLAAVALLVTALAVNGPWIVRNELVYHRFMPSRGNFGLELGVANYAGALEAPDAQQAFIQRMYAIHPTMDGAGRQAYRHYARDIDYFDAVGAETREWIAGHKADFLKLSARHLGELLFPPQWFFHKYTIGALSPMDRLRQVYEWGTAFLGLLMLGVGLARRERAPFLFLVTILPQVLLYSVMQPTIRYRYLLDPLLTYLAVAFVWQLFLWATSLRKGARASRPPA